MENLGFIKANVVAATIRKVELDREMRERKRRVDNAIRIAIEVMQDKVNIEIVQGRKAPIEKIGSDEIIESDVVELSEYGWNVFKGDDGCWYITISDCVCESYGLKPYLT